MTISTRNRILGGAILFSGISFVTAIIILTNTFPLYPEVADLASRRSQGLLQILAVPLLKPAAYAPMAAVSMAMIYAFVSTGLILFFFEKTQSPEILFFAIFTASFSTEGVRMVLPLVEMRNFPQAYMVVAARFMLFSRLLGMFAIFIAGVYSAGLDFHKQGSLLLILAAVSLTIATGVPMDGLSWDSSLTLIQGYRAMFFTMETGLSIITVLSFAIAAYTKGSKEFMETAVGSILVFIGRDGLLHGDTWVAVPIAAVAQTFGTWLICTRLHRYYLWI